MAMTNVERAALIITKATLLKLDGDISLPAPDPSWDLTDSDDLIQYANAVSFRVGLFDTTNFTFNALANQTANLMAAHAAASLVTVAAPTDDQLRTLSAAMDKVSNAIRQDQRFALAATLASSVAAVLKSQLAN